MPADVPMGLCAACLLKAALEVDAPGPATSAKPPSAASPGLPSLRFGDYDVLECLASGGMGVVYKVRHRQLGRLTAVKTVPFGRFTKESHLRRFRAEA